MSDTGIWRSPVNDPTAADLARWYSSPWCVACGAAVPIGGCNHPARAPGLHERWPETRPEKLIYTNGVWALYGWAPSSTELGYAADLLTAAALRAMVERGNAVTFDFNGDLDQYAVSTRRGGTWHGDTLADAVAIAAHRLREAVDARS